MIDPPNREVTVFSAALELPAAQRSAYLDEACAGDDAQRQRVEAFLAAHEEAGAFLEANWDAERNRILIDGRIPVNPHGGALSEGGTQGSGHLREAVHQLQGLAGPRQVAGAHTALITAGGFFFNAQGAALRTD